MSKGKIAVGASSFAQDSDKTINKLATFGYEVVKNPFGRKLTIPETIAHLQGAVGLLAGLEELNHEVFSKTPYLKVIARIGIGMDNMNLDAAQKHGIKVSNTPDGPTFAVAEMTLAALLSITRRIIPVNRLLHAGQWKKQMGLSLKGANVAIIGYGRIGREFERIVLSFGANAKHYDSVDKNGKSLAEVLSLADIVSIHASGKSEIIGAKEIAQMKKGVILLNSARGTLVNETALIKALNSGHISWYWADVFPSEPYGGELIKLDNAVLTPHISTYTTLCREEMETAAVDNLLRDLGETI